MKTYEVKVYKIAGESIVKIEAANADEAAANALELTYKKQLEFGESSRKFTAEAVASCDRSDNGIVAQGDNKIVLK